MSDSQRTQVIAAAGSALLMFAMFAPVASYAGQPITFFRSTTVGTVLLVIASGTFALSISGRAWLTPWCAGIAAYCVARVLIATQVEGKLHLDWGISLLLIGTLCTSCAATFAWRTLKWRKLHLALAVPAILSAVILLNIAGIQDIRVYGSVTVRQALSISMASAWKE
jgi:hypothetical protein